MTSAMNLFQKRDSDPTKTKMKQLLQAIIDDDKAEVEKCLEEDPSLLLQDPQALGIKEIKSNKLDKFFYAEKPFIMAQKGWLLAMTRLLYSYFPKDVQGVQAAKEQYVSSEYKESGAIRSIKNQLTLLMKAIAQAPENEISQFSGSDAIEKQLNTLNQQLCDISINYSDIEMLLLHARKLYNDNGTKFPPYMLSPKKQDFYAVRVIGLLESFMSPELAKVRCTGLYNVVEEKKSIGQQAEKCLFEGEKDKKNKHLSFYPSSRSERKGLGFEFLCGIMDGTVTKTLPFGVSDGAELYMKTQHNQRMREFNAIGNQIVQQNTIQLK